MEQLIVITIFLRYVCIFHIVSRKIRWQSSNRDLSMTVFLRAILCSILIMNIALGKPVMNLLFQRSFSNRLGKIILKSVIQVHFFCTGALICSQRYNRHFICQMLLPDDLQGLDAVHIHHNVVQKNHLIGFLPDLLKGFFAGGSSIYFGLRLFQKELGYTQIDAVIIYHQNGGCRCSILRVLPTGVFRFIPGQCLFVITDLMIRNHLLWNKYLKAGTISGFAAKRNASTHHVCQIIGDRKPDPGSHNGLISVVIGSSEGVENGFLFLPGDTLSGILHLKHQNYLFFRHLLPIYPEGYGTFFSIFHSIAQQIFQDLQNSYLIPIQIGWQCFLNFIRKCNSLAFDFRLIGNHKLVYQFRQIITCRKQLHHPRLYFGVIQYIVYDGQQLLSRFVHDSGISQYLFIPTFPFNHFAHAQYGIDGRSDLMAHAGQKIILCLA